MSKELLKKLVDADALSLLSASKLDLTEYEIRVLFALAEGAKTPSDLSEVAGVPRTKTYEVLNKLVAKGLVQNAPNKSAYALTPHAIKKIIETFEGASKLVAAVLHELDKIHEYGASELIVGEVQDAVKSLGFMMEERKLGSEFLIAITATAHRIAILIPKINDVENSRKLLNKMEDTQPSVILAPKEFLVPIQQLGITARGYSSGTIKEVLIETSREMEHVSRRLDDLESEFEKHEAEFQKHVVSIVSQLKNLSEVQKERADKIRNELESLTLQQNSLRTLWKISMNRARGAGILSSNLFETLKGIVQGSKELLGALDEKLQEAKTLAHESRRLEGEKYYPVIALYPSSLEHSRLVRPETESIVKDALSKATNSQSLQTVLVVGPLGSGKTFLLKWYQMQINRDKSRRYVAAYSAAKSDFLDVYNSLMEDTIRSIVTSEKEIAWPPLLERQSNVLNLDAAFSRALNDLLLKNKFEAIVLMVDEFERASQSGRVFVDQLRYFMEKLEGKPVLLVIAISDTGFIMLQEKFPEFLSRIPNSNITALEPLDEQQVKDLMDYIPEKERQKYSLSKEVLAEIVKKSNGNARGAIQLLNNVFYAAWKEKKPVTVDMVKRIAG